MGDETGIKGKAMFFRHLPKSERNEEGRAQEKEIVRSMLSSFQQAIMICDLNLDVMDCNQLALDLFEYESKDEIIGKNIINFFDEKEHQRIRENAKKTLRRGLTEGSEYAMLTKSGGQFIALMSSRIIKDASGNSLCSVEISRDITNIKHAKESLQRIFNGISDGISIIDRNYKILRVNLSILKMFDKKKFSDLIGKDCFAEFYKKEGVCDHCPARRTFKNGRPSVSIKIYREIDKEKRVLETFAFPIKDRDGKIVQVIECIKNISGKIRLEDQLIAQERVAAIEELASGVAHEIRNPLSNIHSSAQYCLSEYKLSGRIKKHLKIILKNSESADRVVKGLLNFAKPREISFEMGDIREVIKNVCNLIKVKCLSRGVHLTRRLPRNLPQILLDERRLEEVFLNLILNSLDAMPEGGRLTITGFPDFQNNCVAISVSDSGEGIPQENLSKIFDPFFSTKKGGTGLGLCLALQVINDHKGKINIESKVGEGTEVIIRLPILRE